MDLTAIPIVDQHAHNILRPDELTPLDYVGAFTEAGDGEAKTQVRETLFFRRSLRDIAQFLGCEANLDAILAERARVGFDEVARRFIAAANVEALLLDDGFLADRVMPVAWHARFARAYRLVRVERLAEELVEGGASSWTQFVERFQDALANPPNEVVGLKSIVAYRTGLALDEPDVEAARSCFEGLRQRGLTGQAVRLACKPLNDWVVLTALEAAARTGVPVQFHTGFGDPDLDLRLANPLHLRPVFEAPALRRVRVVLLHASYPFTREAAYLASVYANVFVDFGLAVPSLSVAGMRSTIRALLELAPVSKMLFASDAHVIPELFYLGAHWGRLALGAELEQAVRDGDSTVHEADRAAEDILRGNALKLYGLPE